MMENGPRNSLLLRRAFEIYLERGEQPGRELDDWLQAERELERGVLRCAHAGEQESATSPRKGRKMTCGGFSRDGSNVQRHFDIQPSSDRGYSDASGRIGRPVPAFCGRTIRIARRRIECDRDASRSSGAVWCASEGTSPGRPV